MNASSNRPNRLEMSFYVFLLLTAVSGLFFPFNSSWTQVQDDEKRVENSSEEKDKFFSSRRLYYARIQGWGHHGNLSSLREIKEFTSVHGAQLEIFTLTHKHLQHCPTSLPNEALLFRSKKFKMKNSGNKTLGMPKSSYKIKLTQNDEKFMGMEVLLFKSMWNDPSQIREALAWNLFRQAKVKGPRHTYARLCIDGVYMGLFSFIEEVDEAYLKDNFSLFRKTGKGVLYKGSWETRDLGPATLAYRQGPEGDDSGKQYYIHIDEDERTYQIKHSPKIRSGFDWKSYDDLATFIKVLHGRDRYPQGAPEEYFQSQAFRLAMEAVLDVRSFLRWAALNVLFGAFDNYWATPSNYFLFNVGREEIRPPFALIMENPMFHWIPWDYDNSFGITYWDRNWNRADILDWEKEASYTLNGRKAPLPLITHLLKNREFITYYLDFLEHFITHYFNEKKIRTIEEEIWNLIKTSVYLESDHPGCHNSGIWSCAHTGRQFSNHEIYNHVVEGKTVKTPHATIEGIRTYVKERSRSAMEQISNLRQFYPRRHETENF